jgi:hypothetical protein
MWRYCNLKTMECQLCDFKCQKECDWKRHIKSKKHINLWKIIDDLENEKDKLIDRINEFQEENEKLVKQNIKLNIWN